MNNSNEILIRWCTQDANTKGVRMVRVEKVNRRWGQWKDVDRWAQYQDGDLFEDREAAIADGERRRAERRDSLQRQLDKLAKPMRVVEKIKEKAL